MEFPWGEGMRTPDEVTAMLRLWSLGWGAKRIAAELGISRNTVRRCIESGGWAAYRKPRRAKVLDGLEDWLAERLRRHRGNADVVRQELAREHGLVVSLRTVERSVAGLHQDLRARARATVRFENCATRPYGRRARDPLQSLTERSSPAHIDSSTEACASPRPKFSRACCRRRGRLPPADSRTRCRGSGYTSGRWPGARASRGWRRTG